MGADGTRAGRAAATAGSVPGGGAHDARGRLRAAAAAGFAAAPELRRPATRFVALPYKEQDATLQAVSQGRGKGGTWRGLDGKRFYEELLAAVTELYVSQPAVQEARGYTGFADAGWKRIGLGERETWEEDDKAALPPPAPRREVVPEPADMQRFREDETADAVVIGTGAGGGPLLWRLARAGLKVVALEVGRSWHPARDFATGEVAQEALFWTDERLSAGANPLAFGNNNSGIGVGGSTLHYTAYTPRPQPDDFHLRTESGVGCDWPLAYDDLEAYFDDLETFLGVSGPSPYPWGPARKKGYPLAPLPLNGAAQLMARGAAKLGLETSPAPNAALSGPYYQPGVGWRPACTNRGFCQAGCSVGAKASVDVTFIPAAFGLGAEVREETFVTGFERDAQGRIAAVVYQTKDGREARQRCKNVFLCAGAIETPRLLLYASLTNGSGQVGRNFMAHTGTQVWGQFDEPVHPWKGIPGGLISEDTHRPKYNHVAGINILGECLPSETNRVELSDEKDARGLPKPRVSFSAGPNETKLTESAEYLHAMRAVPSRETALTNKLRFLSLDLLYAHPPDGDVRDFLADNGMTREEYDWFMLGEPPGYQVMGNDYYGRNEKLMLPDGSMETAEDVLGWNNFTREYHERYRKPVMHTLRGFGRAATVEAPEEASSYSLDLMAADVIEAISRLGIERYTLIGHPMGGKVALAGFGRSAATRNSSTTAPR